MSIALGDKNYDAMKFVGKEGMQKWQERHDALGERV